MGAIRLGKNHLRWCYGCNLPILESKECPVCGEPTEEIELTPPGDARPAFQHDIDLIRSILDRDYGEGTGQAVLPEGHIVILSKAPALDRMDEVIVDGAVVASLRYDMGSGWKFVSRMQGAYKGYVVCDPGAVPFVRESKNLMAPGVVDADPDIKPGDEILIVTAEREVVATGMARMTGPEMVAADKGVAVKTRWYKPEEFRDLQTPHTWDDVVEANHDVIEKRVTEAVGFIRNTIEKNQKPAIVSFSGGKDSLASLLLTIDAGLSLPVLFVDTGLEFDETVEHVRDVCRRHNLKLIEEKAPTDAFFGNLVYFGPPAKDYRWCCKTNKLGPTVGAVVHRPEEVRVRGQERQAQGLDQPLDPRTDRGVPHPELVRHARVAVHLLQEGALQRVVHPRPAWTGSDASSAPRRTWRSSRPSPARAPAGTSGTSTSRSTCRSAGCPRNGRSTGSGDGRTHRNPSGRRCTGYLERRCRN